MFDFLLPDWSNMVQILVTAPVLYVLVIIAVRLSGNRSTSSMNNFDWIVTVAIGGIFASTVVLDETQLVEGTFGIAVLLGLQYLFTTATRRWEPVRKLLKATPQLLLFKGDFLEENMRRQRIIRGEVFAAIRDKGYKSVDDVYAVVLENNAQLSIIPNENNDDLGFSLADVDGLPPGLKEDLEARGEEDDESGDRDNERSKDKTGGPATEGAA